MTVNKDFDTLMLRAASNNNTPPKHKTYLHWLAIAAIAIFAIIFFSPHSSTNSGFYGIGSTTINNYYIQPDSKKNQVN